MQCPWWVQCGRRPRRLTAAGAADDEQLNNGRPVSSGVGIVVVEMVHERKIPAVSIYLLSLYLKVKRSHHISERAKKFPR